MHPECELKDRKPGHDALRLTLIVVLALAGPLAFSILGPEFFGEVRSGLMAARREHARKVHDRDRELRLGGAPVVPVRVKTRCDRMQRRQDPRVYDLCPQSSLRALPQKLRFLKSSEMLNTVG